MSETSLGHIQPTCPQCGANLSIEWDGIEPKPDDRVFCPVHGEVGTRETVRANLLGQHGNEIGENVAKHVGGELADALKRIGFDVERE